MVQYDLSKHDGEPTTDRACDVCGDRWGNYSNLLADRKGEDVGLCMSCVLNDRELLEANSDVLGTTLEYELCGETFEDELGWVSHGTFGEYSVTFSTKREEALTRTAVDDYKIVGEYIALDSLDVAALEKPDRIEITDFVQKHVDLRSLKEDINEERDQRARERRR